MNEALITHAQLVARIERMMKAASARLHDAELLQQTLQASADSGYLLKLLGFEILLKALVLTTGEQPDRNHSYEEFFWVLPEAVRNRVISRAAERMSTSADYSRVPDLLHAFGKDFIALRYSYEVYDGVSAEAYDGAARGWVNKGAPISEATFVYPEEELVGLAFSLELELRDWLSASGGAGRSPDVP